MSIRRLASLVAICAVAAIASAQPFTYQGRLDENGSPASGTYDLFFQLASDSTGGTLGPVVTIEDVAVVDGLFTVALDFGAGQPSSNFRWLTVGLRDGASTSAFQILFPRQPITAAPFASVDLNEPWSVTGTNTRTATFGDGDDIVLLNRTNRIGSEFFGIGVNTSGFGGMYINTTGTTGQPFYGYATASQIRAYHYYELPNDELRFWVNGSELRFSGFGLLRVPGPVNAADFAYASPQERTTSVHYLAFNPETPSSFANVVKTLASGGWVGFSSGQGAISAPVTLPDGAVITSVEIFYFDNSPADIFFQLIRHPVSGTVGDVAIFSLISTGSSLSTRQLTATPNHTVDGSSAYALRVLNTNGAWDGLLRVRGVRLTYTVTSP